MDEVSTEETKIVVSPNINPNPAEVRPGETAPEQEVDRNEFKEWFDNASDLNLAIAHARHLKDLTPHFRADPAFRSCKYILMDYQLYLEELLLLDNYFSVPERIFLTLKLRVIKELLHS